MSGSPVVAGWNLSVIPGLRAAKSPEPMNTTNAELSPPLRKRMMISTVVVMGSGLGTDAPPRKDGIALELALPAA